MFEKRLSQHNKGQNRSTKAYASFQLFYTEPFSTRKEARQKEKYLKSGIGKEFLRNFYDYFEVVAPERVWEFEPACGRQVFFAAQILHLYVKDLLFYKIFFYPGWTAKSHFLFNNNFTKTAAVLF